MELRSVDCQNLDVRIAEQNPLGTGNKVVETGADADNQIGILAQCVCCQTAGNTDAADAQFKAVRQSGVASLCLGYRNVKLTSKLHNGFARFGVTNAAAGNQERLLCGLNQLYSLLYFICICAAAGDVMYTLLEEVIRILKALALYVLRQADADSTAVSGVGQYAECVNQCRHQLFRTGNAIPVLGNRLEAIGSGDAQVVRNFHLLQYRIRLAGCERVRREQQQRNVVDGCGQRCSYHVCCARADGRRASDDLAAVVLLRIRDSSMCHALLVSALIYTQTTRVFIQRLSQTNYHAVSKDGEDAVYERLLYAVKFDVLLVQELYNCLTYCHLCLAHNCFLLIHKHSSYIHNFCFAVPCFCCTQYTIFTKNKL